MSFDQRLRAIEESIALPFGWEISMGWTGANYILRVGDPHGVDNVTGAAMPWRGRHWLLSTHMTDGEIVQTAFLAIMTAVEHEMRETFLYEGQAIFDPHYDIAKLVELRSRPDALKERVHHKSISKATPAVDGGA